jgi:TonB family protein
VVVSVVFTADGRVSGARVVRGLPDGLNDEAIKAAQKIKFRPAMKNGQPVSVRMAIEFTFNLL